MFVPPADNYRQGEYSLNITKEKGIQNGTRHPFKAQLDPYMLFLQKSKCERLTYRTQTS